MVAPIDKVTQLPNGAWKPWLVHEKKAAPLGEHATLEAAQCAYDVARMLVSSRLGLPAAAPARLCLPPPAAARCCICQSKRAGSTARTPRSPNLVPACPCSWCSRFWKGR